eukprot:scaffold14.g1053.t1
MRGSSAKEPASGGKRKKFKKTVTWADGDELALAVELSSDGAPASARPPEPVAVVVLPADSMYVSLSAAGLLEDQVDTPQPSGETLSRRQVLERRLAAVDRLAGLYEKELWGLFEELRLRAAQFAAQPGVSLLAGLPGGQQQQQGQAPGEQEGQRAAADAPSVRELWQRRQAAKQTEQQQQKQQGEAVEQEQQGQAAAQGQEGQQGKASAAAGGKQQGAAGAAPPAVAALAVAAPAALTPEAARLPTFEEVEAALLEAGPPGGMAPPPPTAEQQLQQQKADFLRHLSLVGLLEQGSLASLCRHVRRAAELDSHGALAALVGRANRYLLRKAAVVLGRGTESKGAVDVDLALEGDAQQVSRQQAQLCCEADGRFVLRCLGRRVMLVNGAELARGQHAALPHLSHIRVGGISLLFVENRGAAARLAARSAALPTSPHEDGNMGAAAEQRNFAMDVLAWFSNVSTSVLIVFVNKLLMKATGYGFHFATTLTALHFLTCTLAIWAVQAAGCLKPSSMPGKDLALFTVVADISILTLNLSLMINTVSFYQARRGRVLWIAKLLIIPFVCFVERVYLGRTFSRETVASIGVVVVGVAVVTVEDLHLDISMGGLIIAAVSVVSSGLQQIFVRTMQQKHKLSSHELLSNTAPPQAWSLLLVGPFIDKLVSSEWVFNYHFTHWGAAVLMLSCSLAILVLGHMKTVMVLLGGWLFLGDSITGRKLTGMGLAVAGMIWYGKASSRPAVRKAVSSPMVITASNGGGGSSQALLKSVSSADLRVVVSAHGSGSLDGSSKREVV